MELPRSRPVSRCGKRAAAGPHPTMKAFLAEGMALTGDTDNALQLIDEIIAQIERPGGRNGSPTQRSCASRAGCSRSRATLTAPNGTF